MSKKENMLLNNTISYIKAYISRYNLNYKSAFERKYITRIQQKKEVQERFLTNANSKFSPIVLLGCSYAYGQHLTNQEAFSGQLATNTDRPVYNLAFIGAGIQHIIYILSNEKIKNKIKNPEYVIYVFISDHVNRLYTGCGYSVIDYLYYKIQKKELVINELYSYIMRLPIPFIISQIVYEQYNKMPNVQMKKNNLLEKHMYKINDYIKRNWKDTKFVIFMYEPSPEMDNIIPNLQKKGIYIIYLDEILKEKNIVFDSTFKLPKEIDKFQHPSASAWEKITPVFLQNIKKIDL